MLDARPEIVPHGFHLLRAMNELLERAGDGAHTSFHALRNELRKNIEEQIGKLKPLAGCPIRRVDLLLHARAVELAVRESVDCKNVTVFLFQPFLEREQLLRFRKFARSLVTQPQADGVSAFRADAIAHSERVAFESIPGFRPALAAMDIGAIGQMQAMRQLHALGSLNFGLWLRKRTGF